MAERNTDVPPDGRIEFRMGINLGDIIKDRRDIYGDGVNIAARLEALAEPGGICVSRVVRDQVRDKLAFSFEDMGEQQVKNIARPIRVHRILLGERPVSPSQGRVLRQTRRWRCPTSPRSQCCRSRIRPYDRLPASLAKEP